MIAKASAWPQTSAPPAGNQGAPAQNPAVAGEGKGFALTSHSFNFTTKLFSLDFTWRRLEVDGPRQTSGTVRQPRARSRLPNQEQAARVPSFDEVLKRQQLAALLSEKKYPPEHCETIQASSDSQAAVFAGPAQRAYSQTVPQGPLSGARLFKA
jgi:hypothetical protein